MKVPLVNPISIDNPEIAEMVKFFNETLGFCPNSVLTMQIRPAIAKAFISLNMAVMENRGRVTSALKRLIGYMASYTAGCQYCQAHTIRAAERYGSEEEKFAASGITANTLPFQKRKGRPWISRWRLPPSRMAWMT